MCVGPQSNTHLLPNWSPSAAAAMFSILTKISFSKLEEMQLSGLIRSSLEFLCSSQPWRSLKQDPTRTRVTPLDGSPGRPPLLKIKWWKDRWKGWWWGHQREVEELEAVVPAQVDHLIIPTCRSCVCVVGGPPPPQLPHLDLTLAC